MPDKTWKQAERTIAKRLGGRRVGCTGRADVTSDWLSIEVKTRKRLPEWLRAALEQASLDAGDKLALVVLHETGQRHDNDLVVLRLRDFEGWFGEVADNGK
ncbi:MAG: hypothetical protein H5T68_07715 [Chloroflexi bacterium]|nr:hypothetical protein [Chloroflexota bacterium]